MLLHTKIFMYLGTYMNMFLRILWRAMTVDVTFTLLVFLCFCKVEDQSLNPF